MLYQICNGGVTFAADTILENINFEIRDTEKIAVVGRNGSGKSTLLRLIAGEVDLAKRDSDEHIFIATSGSPRIGYLKQMTFEDESITLDEEINRVFEPVLLLARQMEDWLHRIEKDPSEVNVRTYSNLQEAFENLDGYNYSRDYDMVLTKFGFSLDDKTKRLSEFSGGQKTKIAFVKLLLSKPDILLLDEPTNHLDMSTVEWLEKYLLNYPKAVVIVSHDRMFLDQVVSVVYEIEYKTARRYPGNYTDFTARKKINWEKQMKDHVLQQKEIERLKVIIDKFKNKPTKVAMTRSKLKQIEHMDVIEAPDQYDARAFHTDFTPARVGGKEALNVNSLKIGYTSVLTQVELHVANGKKIGIIGDNGTGKSTFLKTIVDLIPSLGGIYHYGYQIDIGYFDQNTIQYSGDKTVLDEFWDEFPTMTQTEVRNALGAFLFVQDDVFKKMDMLSGGERARLALCKLFRRRPNFLILDEPTNHMDIIGKETLEAILKDFPGTVLFVSHDRYFIRQVADTLLSFEGGSTKLFPYGYEQYMEYRQAVEIKVVPILNKVEVGYASPRKTYASPEKELQRKQKQIEKLEIKMETIEEDIARLKEELHNPSIGSNYVKLQQVQSAIDEKELEQEQLIENWTQLHDSL